MNQKEWKSANKLGIKLDFTYYNKSHRILKDFNADNNASKTEVHHLRDTEEQRKYNDECYELWGFEIDENGNEHFEYSKYVIFVTKEEHIKIHKCSEETRAKISASSKKNWLNEDFRKRVIGGNTGKVMPESAKQTLREIHLGEKNHMYGKHPSDETRRKMRESCKSFWERNDSLKDHYREILSGENNAMYGKHGKDHPKYGVKLSDETKKKISENNGIKKIHALYLKYKSNGGTIGWHEFQKLPKNDRLILSGASEDGAVKELIPQMETIKEKDLHPNDSIIEDSYVPEVEDDYDYMQ